MRSLSRAVALLFVLSPAALAQKLLQVHIGDANQQRLGQEVRGAGDVDGDGLDDYVLGVAAAAPSGSGSGQVRVYCGVDGLLLRTLDGAAAGDGFGTSVVGVGDVNGDGRGDLLVGAPGAGTGGKATLFSGLDGSVLRTHSGLTTGDEFGGDVEALGDVDLDGTPDYAVGATRDNSGPNATSGAVHVFSGSSGGPLYVKYGDGHLDDFGAPVRGVGDVDGDGRPDFFVGAVRDDDGGSQAGGAHLVSGATGATLWRNYGAAAGDRLGATLDGAGADMDGDGVPDVVVGTGSADYVRVLSGANGALIMERDGAATGGSGGEYGRAVFALGDIDGDALGEYGVGDHTAYLLGQVRVYSGAGGREIFVLTWVDQNDRFGMFAARVGDLDGDGLHEFGVGADAFDFGGLGNVGRVGIYSPQPPIGVNYCGPATVGSSGVAAAIRAYGSPVIADECFSLTASGLPIATFGYFIAGTAQGSVMPGGSIGTICIGGANVARFNTADKVIRGPGGSVEVDLLQIPGNPPRPVMPGESWHFQCWFRDSTSGGSATSNFSDAVRVTFS